MRERDELQIAIRVGQRHYTDPPTYFKNMVELITDGYGAITGLTNKEKLKRLEIPVEYEGVAIVSIGDSAFISSPSLESAVIPETVECIERRAFAGCSELRSIRLPRELLELGDEAFARCSKLRAVELPPHLDTIGQCAFALCTSLESIILPKAPFSLGQLALSDTPSLHSAELRAAYYIGSGAFMGSGIEEIILGRALRHLGSRLFAEASSLKRIYYDGTIDELRRVDMAHDWNSGLNKDAVLYLRDDSNRWYNAFANAKEEERPTSSSRDRELLGLSEKEMDSKRVRRAYMEKVKKFHPDVLSGLNLDSAYAEFAASKFREYTLAYERIIEEIRKGV